MSIYSGMSYASSPNVGYRVEVSQGARSVNSVYLVFTIYAHLRYAQSWLGTGHVLTAYIYANGAHSAVLKSYSSVWRGTGEHAVSIGVWLPVSPTQTKVNGIGFSANNSYDAAGRLGYVSCNEFNIDASSEYSAVKGASLEVASGGLSNNQIVVELSGMSAISGYTRNIEWTRDGVSCGVTTPANGEDKLSYTFTSLLPAKTYNLSARIYTGSTTIRTITIKVTTSNESLVLNGSTGPTMATIIASEMQSMPAYTRTIRVYVKQSDAYQLVKTVQSQADTATLIVENLSILTAYTFKVEVTDGTNVFTSATIDLKTILSAEDLPKPYFKGVWQTEVGGNVIVEWDRDKRVEGVVYKLIATNLNFEKVITSSPVEIPVTADVHAVLTLEASHPEVTGSQTATVELWCATKFSWSGLSRLSAADWNSLLTKAGNLLKNYGVTYFPTRTAETGCPVSAALFNELRLGIQALGGQVLMRPKLPGDQIVISEITALADAYNSLSF